MKEKPRNIRAGLSRRGYRGGLGGSPSNYSDQRPSLRFVPALSLCKSSRNSTDSSLKPVGLIFRKGSSRRYATRILEVTELSSFQFVLVPFLVSPNSDSQVSQLTNRAYAYQLSVDRWWFCEMLTYPRAKPASTADLSRSKRHSGGGRPVSYWCVA